MQVYWKLPSCDAYIKIQKKNKVMKESDQQKISQGLNRDFARPNYCVNDIKPFNLNLRAVDADVIRHIEETNRAVRRGL